MRGASRPGFFWQGTLIVLPAILLGSAGFYSLRQDRLLAEREASEQGRLIVSALARDLLPKALALQQADLAALERWRELPGRPQDEPVLGLARKSPGRLACLVDAQAGLVYPPPLSPEPAPQPLDEDELPQAQRAEWTTLCSPAAAGNDVAAAIAAGERFLAQAPLQRFAAAGCYRLGLLCLKQGEPAKARKFLEQVAARYPDAVGEAGYSLKTYAQVQLLKLADGTPASAGGTKAGWRSGPREELINAICAQAVFAPSPLSLMLLRQVAARETSQPLVAGWLQVVQAHELARALQSQVAEAAAGDATNGAMTFRSCWLRLTPFSDWLVTWHPAGTNYWLVARPEEQARQIIHETLARMVVPAYLGVSVELAGRRLGPDAPAGDLLAAGSASLSPDHAAPDARVSVHLSAPGQLYARQHKRTIWFGALIAASVAAVLAGFFTAWRAFRRQQQLNELKDNFVSAVSHELRAPIASIRLMSEELEDFTAPDPARSRDYHHLIHQECRRLSRLIENVLDFARQEQGRQQYIFESTDLQPLVEATVKLMQPCAAEGRVTLTATFQGQCRPVELDGRALQQALVNLIDNAIKHSPPDANVAIGVEFGPASSRKPSPNGPASAPFAALGMHSRLTGPQPSPDGPLPLTLGNLPDLCRRLCRRLCRKPAKFDKGRDKGRDRDSKVTQGPRQRPDGLPPATLRLWVEDAGQGIPPEEHERIFDRFYRCGSELRRSTQGVGLGLAIVKYVAEAHGGKVSVSSALGQGSRFTLELPLVPRPTP
jgi:signal transduction histidine kinase